STSTPIERRSIVKNLFIFGKAGSGKTTTANYLRSVYGYRTFALADPIKKKIAEMLGREPTKADRTLLIDFGQTYRTWFGDDVWCRVAWENILDEWRRDLLNRGLTPGQSPVLIEDGRHLVECFFFVTERWFDPILVVASEEVRFHRLLERDGVDQRALLAGQETELDGVAATYTIVNDGNDLDELYRKVDEIVRHMREEG